MKAWSLADFLQTQAAKDPKNRRLAFCPDQKALPPASKPDASKPDVRHDESYFFELLRDIGIPVPDKEYEFHHTRRWRTDYIWHDPAYLALEIEGGAWVLGRHNRPASFIKEMAKYNALAAQGYRLLRFTPSQLTKPESINTIKEAYYGG